MQIRITRTVKKVGLFNRSIELEETVFLNEFEDDSLYLMINSIGLVKKGFTFNPPETKEEHLPTPYMEKKLITDKD